MLFMGIILQRAVCVLLSRFSKWKCPHALKCLKCHTNLYSHVFCFAVLLLHFKLCFLTRGVYMLFCPVQGHCVLHSNILFKMSTFVLEICFLEQICIIFYPVRSNAFSFPWILVIPLTLKPEWSFKLSKQVEVIKKHVMSCLVYFTLTCAVCFSHPAGSEGQSPACVVKQTFCIHKM